VEGRHAESRTVAVALALRHRLMDPSPARGPA
jgi:hypothetical protein